ncbi:ABC transporter substrate-binding protein [Mycobacterium neglectum]|uniref:ABC transporter substrate-binding protein n=1 Tax=Mycobacterium neglectum TaxID=242737 RepID=UPI000BFEDCBA|nr:ABC transporter substrate-binding protein [Mycobacterium neglectum]
MSRSRIVARTLAGLSVAALALAACGSGGGGESSGGGETLQAIAGTNVDFISLVPIAAWKILEEEEGIKVEQRFVEDGATAIQGMQQGAAVIGTNIGVNTGVPAVDNGATIVDVVGTQRPTWALAVAPDINNFSDLEGKRIAVHGETSFTRAVAQYYAKEEGFTYEELIIPGSDVRAEALAKGQIDASVIDLPDVVQLSKEYPGSFKVLSTFGEQFPDLIEQDLWLSKQWATDNPELATKVVKAIVQANRKLTEDPAWGLEIAKESLPDMDPGVLEDLVNEYSERQIWSTDGGITPDKAQTTLQFFQDVGEINIGAADANAVEKYFDFSYLDSALAELDGNGSK